MLAMVEQGKQNLTYENTKDLIPVLEEADDNYWREIRAVKTDDDIKKAVKKYNGYLELAIEAIYEDTKDRNNHETLRQVYMSKNELDTHFGVNPLAAIKEIIHI